MAFDKIFAQNEDGELFELGKNGISEQTLTFRLGLHLQNIFPHHKVDCEYNRLGADLKTAPRVGQKWMKPDVIVHARGIKRQNLIVIEAKKSGGWKRGLKQVRRKLKAFTRRPADYEYKLGLAWKIAFSQDPAKHEVIWYARGREVAKTTLHRFENDVIAALSGRGRGSRRRRLRNL